MSEEKIKQILTERTINYGEFKDQARYSQALKEVLHKAMQERYHLEKVCFQNYQQEALEMILHKIARIINGDPNYKDSWVDIVGYAQLVVDRLPEVDRGN